MTSIAAPVAAVGDGEDVLDVAHDGIFEQQIEVVRTARQAAAEAEAEFVAAEVRRNEAFHALQHAERALREGIQDAIGVERPLA